MIEGVLLYVVQLGSTKGDLWLSTFLYIAILLFAWSKNKLGDIRGAIIFTLVIMILIFYQHPTIVWLALAFYVYSNFGKVIFKVAS